MKKTSVQLCASTRKTHCDHKSVEPGKNRKRKIICPQQDDHSGPRPIFQTIFFECSQQQHSTDEVKERARGIKAQFLRILDVKWVHSEKRRCNQRGFFRGQIFRQPVEGQNCQRSPKCRWQPQPTFLISEQEQKPRLQIIERHGSHVGLRNFQGFRCGGRLSCQHHTGFVIPKAVLRNLINPQTQCQQQYTSKNQPVSFHGLSGKCRPPKINKLFQSILSRL